MNTLYRTSFANCDSHACTLLCHVWSHLQIIFADGPRSTQFEFSQFSPVWSVTHASACEFQLVICVCSVFEEMFCTVRLSDVRLIWIFWLSSVIRYSRFSDRLDSVWGENKSEEVFSSVCFLPVDTLPRFRSVINIIRRHDAPPISVHYHYWYALVGLLLRLRLLRLVLVRLT